MVQIEQHVWGMTPEGEAIIRYTLRNDSGAEVQLTNYGAAIVSSTEPPRERAWDAAPTASPSGR